MKLPVIVTLILAGAALILTPPLVNWAHARDLMRALAANESSSRIYVKEPITPTYALGCWSVGALLLLAGVGFSVRRQGPAATY